MGQEPLRGEPGSTEIAPGESPSGDVHLAGDADGREAELIVEDVQLAVWQDSADGASSRGRKVFSSDLSIRDVYGGLGDSVHVDESRSSLSESLEPGFEGRDVECLSAEDDDTQGEFVQALVALLTELDEPREGGRGLIQDGDFLVDEKV